MKFLLYDRHYTPGKAVLHWVSAFLAFGTIPILLHFFTVEYDLFQGVFVGSFVVAVEYFAYYLGKGTSGKI